MLKHTIVLIFLASCVSAGTVQFQWSASESDVQLNSFNQWDVVGIEEGMPVFANGYPNLPGVPRCYVIPQGTSVTAVEVSNIRTVSLGRAILPSPVMILPGSGDVSHYPDYTEVCFTELSGSFPESPVAGFKTGTKTGFRLGSYSFVPFRYSVDSGELFLITSADITLVYESDSEAPVYSLTEGQTDLAKKGLRTFVDNPEMLDARAPSQRAETDADVEVLIVGYLEHSTQLAELVSLHETMGYTAEYREFQWIQDNMEGYDTPEQIRNYIIDYYENNGLLFAVLVSDAGETTRISSLNFPDCYPALLDSFPPMNTVTDLYFSDLDGTWDANGNHLYGEEADGIDYYSDIYVGRYPTDLLEVSQLNTMITKTLQYNTSPVAGSWQNRSLLIGAALYPGEPGPWVYGSKVCDSLATFFPSGMSWDTVYEDSVGNHPNNQLDLFNQGTALMAYSAHGLSQKFSWLFPLGDWTPIFSCDTVQYMTNGEKLPWVIGRMSCNGGRILETGLSEMFVEHNGGGAIIAATSSSWSFEGHTEPGPAAWLDIYFCYLLFQHDLVTAGVTNGMCKDMFWANWNTFYLPRMAEWELQETNLLGDPCTVFIGAPMGVENLPPAQQLVCVSPNPVRQTMSISVTLSETTAINLTVYDMSGRVALSSGETVLGQGEHELELDASGLTNGVYMVRSNTGDQDNCAKCIVLQ